MIGAVYRSLKLTKDLVKSLSMLLLMSRLPKSLNSYRIPQKKPCLIVGNGPSLKETVIKHRDFFRNKTAFCVNDFISSSFFEEIKPVYCLFTDPLYWQKKLSPRFQKLCQELNGKLVKAVDWKITIFLPMAARKWNYFVNLPKQNKNISICYVNTTPLSGPRIMRHIFYKLNLAMPVVQNVLVGAIFLALNMKYKEVYLVGADHSWHENMHINNENLLLMSNTRFQDTKKAKSQPFYFDAEEKIPYQMHSLLRDLSHMFESYLEVEDYANKIGAKIYNASTKSYIDAFERYSIK